jgi:hypothetical protein
MVFPPLDPAIKEKLISAYLRGHRRNQIVREFYEQGVKVSAGSVSNIINAYKRKHEQPLQSDTSGAEQASIITPRDGGPLSNFLSENIDSVNNQVNNFEQKDFVQKQEFEDIDFEETPVDPEIFSNPEIPYDPRGDGPAGERLFTHSYPTNQYPNIPSNFNPFFNQQIPESRRLEIPETTTINHVTTQNETTEEEEEREFQQPKPSLPKSENPAEIDWDSDEVWQRRFVRIIMDDKKERQHEFQLLEQQREELAIEKHNLDQVIQSIDQRENNLRTREAKLKEIEPLSPSVKELQDWGITFNIIFPYIMAIHQKAVEENIDLNTSASNLIHDIRENRQLGTLQSTIKHLEERVSALNELNTQKQQAVITLMNLQMAGFSEKDIAELVELVIRWKGGPGTPGLGQGNGHKKVDTELIGVGN